MSLYRKKPIEVEAVQWDGQLLRHAPLWIHEAARTRTIVFRQEGEPATPVLMIHTLEGDMKASIGDYIIQGVNGEIYPCKPDIFEKSYESVTGAYLKSLENNHAEDAVRQAFQEIATRTEIGPEWTHITASAYRAYAAAAGNRNFLGEPMPAFEHLPESIQNSWEAAARHVAAILLGGEAVMTAEAEQTWQGWKRP